MPDKDALGAEVAAQGDVVRKLKTEKASKAQVCVLHFILVIHLLHPQVDDAVKKLLALKSDYKAATGNWHVHWTLSSV